MAKEKSLNPVQAQRKADKAKAIKKGKAEVQGRRNEKLARKNPERIQKQIDDLKAITTTGGKLSRHEEQMLDGLEKELKAVKKARDTLGDKAPSVGGGGGRGGPREWSSSSDPRGGGGSNLGKRGRRWGSPSGSDEDDDDVPEDVKRIPMPRDTPPPIPKEEMDRWWAKRRARREAENAARRRDTEGTDDSLAGRDESRGAAAGTPVVESKTVYEAKPVVRDLRKEAVAAFVPAAVQRKLDKGKGQGVGLIEPEEADRLEEEGYMRKTVTVEDAAEEDD